MKTADGNAKLGTGCIVVSRPVGDTDYNFNESGDPLIKYPSKEEVLDMLQSREVKIGVIIRGKSEIIDY
jgi:hypothetical protein